MTHNTEKKEWEKEIDDWFGRGAEGDWTRGRFSIKEAKSFIRTEKAKSKEEGRREGENRGIIRTLKWVKFLFSYKGIGAIKEQVDIFLRETVEESPELKNLERY